MKIKLKDLTEEQYKKWKEENCFNEFNEKCSSCPFFRVECSPLLLPCWVGNKDLYSDKFLNQEIEIDVKDKDETLLTKEEKEYLEGVIKPFKDKVEYIIKFYVDEYDPKEYIYISIKNDFPTHLPCFKTK